MPAPKTTCHSLALPPLPLNPKPLTLHSTPYTLHPTPHTLHPTTHTLQPTPHTRHPTPYTLHPTPYTLISPVVEGGFRKSTRGGTRRRRHGKRGLSLSLAPFLVRSLSPPPSLHFSLSRVIPGLGVLSHGWGAPRGPHCGRLGFRKSARRCTCCCRRCERGLLDW